MAPRNKASIGLILFLIVAMTALLISKSLDQPQDHDSLIRVDLPRQNQMIQSPLVITGQARGMWYFEATFPIKLLDAFGNVIAEGSAQAQGEWTTDQFVSFRAEIDFTKPATTTGVLVLEKSNPSGLSKHEDSIKVPVRFK